MVDFVCIASYTNSEKVGVEDCTFLESSLWRDRGALREWCDLTGAETILPPPVGMFGQLLCGLAARGERG